MDVKPINCNIKPAVHMKVGDHKVDFHSGCSVIDVSFPNTFYVEVIYDFNKYKCIRIRILFSFNTVHDP